MSANPSYPAAAQLWETHSGIFFFAKPGMSLELSEAEVRDLIRSILPMIGMEIEDLEPAVASWITGRSRI